MNSYCNSQPFWRIITHSQNSSNQNRSVNCTNSFVLSPPFSLQWPHKVPTNQTTALECAKEQPVRAEDLSPAIQKASEPNGVEVRGRRMDVRRAERVLEPGGQRDDRVRSSTGRGGGLDDDQPTGVHWHLAGSGEGRSRHGADQH